MFFTCKILCVPILRGKKNFGLGNGGGGLAPPLPPFPYDPDFRYTGRLFLGCAIFIARCNIIRALRETKKE